MTVRSTGVLVIAVATLAVGCTDDEVRSATATTRNESTPVFESASEAESESESEPEPGSESGPGSESESESRSEAEALPNGSDVALTESGACGEAFFWAATPAGDVAVTVTVEADRRSSTERTTIPISLSDPAVIVEVLRGRQMTMNFCTDVISTDAQPTSTMAATAGEGEIVLDAAPPEGEYTACGSTRGSLRLTGLDAEDGTTFAPITLASETVGCYSG